MKKNKCYIIYTLIFSIMSLLIFSVFIKAGRSFVWNLDGIKQHYIILYDFNQIVRNMFKSGIPMISWNMGLGLDFIGQYSYYIIGDPFAYLSLLFPMQHLNVAYNFLVILRIYFVGISFIAFCKYKQKECTNTIIGAIMYTFCGFILFAGIRHPYFTNAAILLPLNFIGMEKILNKNKKTFFIFIIFITAICNYYFFYMISIITVLYGIVKYIIEYNKGIKEFIKKFLLIGLLYLVGILIASVILLPTIYAFLNSARTDISSIVKLDFKYYCKLFIGFICIRYNNWSIIAVPIITVTMLPVLFGRWRQKEEKIVIIMFFITSIILLLPILSSFMNGMSFPNNRWIFAYTFILSYIVTLCYKPKLDYTKQEKKYMILFLIIYIIIGIGITRLNIKRYLDFYTACFIGIITIFLIVIKYKKEINVKKINIIIIVSIFINIVSISLIYYSSLGKNYSNQFIYNDDINRKLNTVNDNIKYYKQAIEYIKKNDKSFYRIANVNGSYQNISLIYDYNPIQTYLSIENGNVYNLSSNIDDNSYSGTKCINGMDRRTKITTLLGVKYYICSNNKKQYIPYGYRLYHEIENTQIYINENYLSPGIIYNNYMLEDEFNSLNSLEKEDSLINTAIIQQPINNVTKNENIEYNQAIKKVNYTIKNENIQDNKLDVKKENKKVIIETNNIEKNCEIYLKINNLKFENKYKNKDNSYEIKAKFNGVSNKEETLDKNKSAYYKENSEILMNLGISKDFGSNGVKITFCDKGIYSWDSLEILAVPMKKYKSDIKVLRNNCLSNIEYGNDYISGNINAKENGILQITTSYSDGWSAYVDGKKVKLLKVNEAFIGCFVEKGNHSIIFKYETPYLRIGIVLSIVGLILYLVVIIFEKTNINKRKK